MKAILSIAIAGILMPMCGIGAGSKATVKKTCFTESELRTLSGAAVDINVARQLYAVAKAANSDAGRQQEYYKAAAACLIACGKIDIYRKHVKGKLKNSEGFESNLMATCRQCSGEGAKKRLCHSCNGKGRCSKCGGSGCVKVVKFNSPVCRKGCSNCNGSGQCPKCEGIGSKHEKCWTCAGTGKIKQFSKAASERAFRDLCNAIAHGIAAEARAKAEAEERERNRRAAEARAKDRKEAARIEREQMEALGLVSINGKWMTPGSLRGVLCCIVQIVEPGRAICVAGGRVICLLYSSDKNPNASAGDMFIVDLYRCGTYSYVTVMGAPQTIAKFAVNLDVALEENQK